MAAIWKYGIILVLCAMLALVFGAAAGTFAARASTGFARNLRHDMYYNVQNFSFSNIDKFSTGSIVTRLTTDVTNVQNAFQMCTRIAVRCPVMLVFALFMAMKISSRMALIFLAVLPILAIGLGILMKVVGPVFERAFKIYDRMNTVVQENVRGIRVVKTYVREDHETEKFEGVSGMLYRTFSKAQKTMAGVMPLMQFCMYACMLLISWFGARLIVGGSMTTGELTSMFSYAMQILMSLMMVAMVFVMITMAKASAERVAEILDEQPDLHNPANPIHEVKDGAIEFDDVSFSYKGDERKLALKKRQPAYQGRSDRRHSRRHRFREVYARAADSAPVRYHARHGQGRRRGCPRLRYRGAARSGCHGAPEERAVLRHDQGKPSLG